MKQLQSDGTRDEKYEKVKTLRSTERRDKSDRYCWRNLKIKQFSMLFLKNFIRDLGLCLQKAAKALAN